MRSRWIAPVLWAGLIETLTTWPSLPDVPAPAGTDKAVHFGLYAVLSYLALRAARIGRPTPRVAVAVVLSVIAWGALDEWHQQFLATRSMEFADWVADSTGALAGLLLRFATARVATGAPHA